MAFTVTKQDLKKSVKCPPGMHLATLITVDEPYMKENGNTVQKCEFETDAGYVVPTWFNDSFMGSLIEFVEAADKIKFDLEKMQDTNIELKAYLGKKVALSVSHVKSTKDNKINAQIDNFFSADKVPF